MTEKRKSPAIRFRGYTDDWEQRKLSDLAEKTYGGGTPTTLNEAYWNGDIPWIQSSDVMDGKLLGVEPRKWITQAGLNNSAAQLIPENSIAIITRVGVGKLAFMPYSYATSQDFLSLSKLNAEPFFTVYACYKELQTGLNAVQGTSIKGITKDELLAKNIMVPRYAEQQQIGAFFKNLDHLITLHQRKLEKLKLVKKSMLEKMFPKNGSSVPEIRFNGFTDDWEQRKLGDVLERRIEQRQQSEEYPRLAFASGQGVIPLSERKTNNREQLTKDEYTKKYLVTELNDIVYNPANVKYGAIDRNKCGRGLISPIYVTFTTNEISGFIERIVTSHDFQQRSLRFEEGTVTKRQSVNPEDLVTLDILVAPKREEQQKIATYFDNLDRLITLHQRKVEKLNILKKSMLEKMFV